MYTNMIKYGFLYQYVNLYTGVKSSMLQTGTLFLWQNVSHAKVMSIFPGTHSSIWYMKFINNNVYIICFYNDNNLPVIKDMPI